MFTTLNLPQPKSTVQCIHCVVCDSLSVVSFDGVFRGVYLTNIRHNLKKIITKASKKYESLAAMN